MITLSVRRYLALASLALLAIGCVSPAVAALTQGDGLVLLNTSTQIGAVGASQTLTLDLMTAEVGDVEMRVVNTTTNQAAVVITKLWDFSQYAPRVASWSNGAAGVAVSISSGAGQDIVDITGIPAGDYRIELDMLVPDYWSTQPNTWHLFTNYFNGSYGALFIDVGADISDVWSWGGASIALQ